MSASKRPSTSSLRRFITTRPYVTVAELRRRFCLECDGVASVERQGAVAFIGLPEREAAKLQELWQRDEVGLELSVEVHAPVVVGVYPMRIARFVQEQTAAHVAPTPASRPTLGEPMPVQLNRESHRNGNGAANSNGHGNDGAHASNVNDFTSRSLQPHR
jgi:hypothetical protein